MRRFRSSRRSVGDSYLPALAPCYASEVFHSFAALSQIEATADALLVPIAKLECLVLVTLGQPF